MRLNCQKCGADIPAANINVKNLVAKCNQCDSVFNFASQVESSHIPTFGKQLPAPQPDKIQVMQEGGQLKLQWSWFHWRYIPMILFALFWNGIVFTFVGGGIAAILNGEWIGSGVFLLPHFWIGVYLIYYIVAGFVNKTTVTVDHGTLRVRHWPIPSWGNKTIRADEIAQLYTKNRTQSGRPRTNSWYGNFGVSAVTHSGKHEKVLSGLDESESALFIEQTIEAWLGIADQSVRGEYGR